MSQESIDRLEELDLPHPDFDVPRPVCGRCKGYGYVRQRLSPDTPPVKMICPRCQGASLREKQVSHA